MESTLCTMATCVLNQWAMDFEGNKGRILRSIVEAKRLGAAYRLGPELEIPGYGCSDHFYEGDTFFHSWQVLADLLVNPDTRDIVCDVGMPIRHNGVAYNCRVAFLNGRILLIRPKTRLADDGNYRESRWFSRWTKRGQVDPDFALPDLIQAVAGQAVAPFGDAVLAFRDASLGFETCEEVWTIGSSHIDLFLNGVDIVVNSSGSYHQLRKLNRRVELITSCTNKAGGLYLYSNLRGCDGERVYYDGAALVALNGRLVAQSRQFSLEEVEVTAATVDLDEVRNCRQSNRSHCQQSAEAPVLARIPVPEWRLCRTDAEAAVCLPVNAPIDPRYHTPEEEIALGPACWLWDYLRRSGQAGFFLPLSGGIDSTSTACLVYSMSVLVFDAVQGGSQQVLSDLRRIVRDPNFSPTAPREICSRLFTTCYMGSENSSSQTRLRAEHLAKEIGSSHLCLRIDAAVAALVGVFFACTGLQPRFRAHGGSQQENLALQNVQARVRMVLAYLFAQLVLLTRGLSGSLLVLGSANLDEGLRGYMTKYDCSSADVNPIGGISKSDLRAFIRYAQARFGMSVLGEIFDAVPTAELEPLEPGGKLAQTDEADMGMTYEELSIFGRLRKLDKCGPVSMFLRLRRLWPNLAAGVVADKVKHFFRSYSINRHKVTVLTPSYHAEAYNIDDNRFDHRQFLYNVNWPWQFACIDQLLASINAGGGSLGQMGEGNPAGSSGSSSHHHSGTSSSKSGGSGSKSDTKGTDGSGGGTFIQASFARHPAPNNRTFDLVTAATATKTATASVGHQGCLRLLAQIRRQRAGLGTPIPLDLGTAAAAAVVAMRLRDKHNHNIPPPPTRRRAHQHQPTTGLGVGVGGVSSGMVHKRRSYNSGSDNADPGLVSRLTLSPRGPPRMRVL